MAYGIRLYVYLKRCLMETKRCTQCHKLLRAETQICSRCGYAFPEKKRKTPTRDLTRPSLPPASPHRAGHYSGLHPEDQPYQSSMVAIQRPPPHEAEDSSLGSALPEFAQNATFDGEKDTPTVIIEPAERPYMSPSFPIAPEEVGTQRILYTEHAQAPLTSYVARAKPLQDTDGVLPALYRPARPRKAKSPRRIIPFLLTLSCIFFLLASVILTYALLKGKFASSSAALTMSADPATVRVGDTIALSGLGFAPTTQVKFTHDLDIPLYDSMKKQLDATTDHRGAFTVDVIVPLDWSVGQHGIHATDDIQQVSTSTTIAVQPPSTAPPQLQLSTTSIDLGIGRAGTTSSKQVTLKNVGGGALAWQQSSDATWLTASPISNSYTFSGSSPITVTANRSNLAPKMYTGHMTFTQKSSPNVVKLTVTMSVDTTPAALNVSTSSLTFSTTATQNVPTQAVTLQNSGGKPLNWQATTTTNDGAGWLYLAGAASGQIDAKQSQQLMIGVQAQQLAVGVYQGTIILTGGASATITVSLSVVAAGNILVSPSALAFTVLTGQGTTGKTLTIQNSGGQAQGWSVGAATADRGNWLSVTTQSGTVDMNTSTTVTVNVASAALKEGAYQGMLTFSGGNQTIQIPVSLAITTPPAAIIAVQSPSLTFQTAQGTDPLGQLLTITNTGNAPLNWTASESGDGATFAPLSQTSGSLPPQAYSIIEVNPSTSAYNAGTLNTMLTIADSDVGTTVASQKIPITITLQSQATIAASPANVGLDTSGPGTNTQTVTVTNTGSAVLNWVLTVHIDDPIGGTWLTASSTGGTLTAGASKAVLITGMSKGLQRGTSYSGTVVISDSDTGTTVSARTVYITFSP